MSMPPLSDAQMAVVHHGSFENPPGVLDMSRVRITERTEYPRHRQDSIGVGADLDDSLQSTVQGDCEVFRYTGEGKWCGWWYAVRTRDGGSSQTSPQPTMEAALDSLARDVAGTLAFWRSYAERVGADVTSKGERIVRCDGWHYVLGREPSASELAGRGRDGLGCGGRRWEFIMASGQHVVSHNVWSQGRIPSDLRELLPDNATQAVPYGPLETHAHYVGRMHKGHGALVFGTPLVLPPTAADRAAHEGRWT